MLKNEHLGSVRTIGIFRALKLGDMLCSVPALRAIRRAYPNARISLIGMPASKEFSKRFAKYIDDFVTFPGYPGLPEQQFNIKKFMTFLKKISSIQFDLLLQMHGNGRISNGITRLFRAKKIAGFYPEGSVCPDKKTFVPFPENLHEIKRPLLLLKHIGIPTHREDLEFEITRKDLQSLKRITAEYKLLPKQYVCIHPGCVSAVSWDPYKFAKVANRLSTIGFKVVLTGLEHDKKVATTVAEYMNFPSINLTGKTDLGTLAAILKNSYLLVANDTAVSQLASALKVPSVVVFTSSDPKIWAPLDRDLHRVVYPRDAYDPNNVLQEVENIRTITKN